MRSFLLAASVFLALGLSIGAADFRGKAHGQAAPREAPRTSTEGMRVVEGIEATEAVQALLEKMRDAIGGSQLLLGVKSLVIDGDRNGMTFSVRILFPDRVQWKYGPNTFTLDGPSRYVQVPPADEGTQATARKNTIKQFVTQSLTLLVRAPSALNVRATLPKLDRPGVIPVMFTTAGGFAVLVEVDPTTFTPSAYSYIGNLEEGQCEEPSVVTSATRRVAFDEFKSVAGIRFPVVMTDTISSSDGRISTFTVRHTAIHVNEGLTQADFER